MSEGKPATSVVTRTILRDAPADDDKFSGGGHQRTAEALSRAIQQSTSFDRAIGLEGSWGSGKSSIVRMAERELRSADKEHSYHVFTFDLWANQTGHFKRAFLESLLNWAWAEFPSCRKKVDGWKNEIGSRKQRIWTNNYKVFSGFGVITLIFLYLTPLIYGWLSPSALRDSTGKFSFSALSFVSTLILVLYCVALLIVVNRAVKGPSKTRWRDAFSRTLSVFSRDAEEKKVNQSIRDEDPTQYEFGKLFRSILSELQGKKHRVIIVFDNIDRLPNGRIADAWSEVRAAFYGPSNITSPDSIATAIIPYAEPVALKAMQSAAGADTASDSSYVEEDVFRKSFDIIFNVSPPVLSDTSAFFCEKFKEAVGDNVSAESIRRAYRIFDLFVEKTGRPVTPRQVISFINDVTSFWEQWQGEIPIESISVFVAHKARLLRDPGALRLNDTLDSRMVQHAGQADIYRDLASLSFNVERALAFQVLSREAIRRALISDTSSELQALADAASVNGFAENLHKVIDEFALRWSEEDLPNLNSAVRNLADVIADAADLEYSRKTLLSVVRAKRTLPFDQIASLGGLWRASLFCGASELPAFVGGLIGAINRGLPEAAKQTFEQGKAWIKTVAAICDAVEAAHGEAIRDQVLPFVMPPVGGAAVVGAAYDCDTTKYHMRQFRKPVVGESLLTAIDDYTGGSEVFLFAWPELAYLFSAEQKRHLITSNINSIRQNELENADEIKWGFESLRLILNSLPYETDSIRSTVRELYSSGAPMMFAKRSADADKLANEVTAFAVWLAMREFGTDIPQVANPQQLPVFGNILSEYNWFSELLASDDFDSDLAALIGKFATEAKDVGFVFDQACVEADGRDVYKKVARALLADENVAIPSLSTLIAKFMRLKEVLGPKFERLLVVVGTDADEGYWTKLNFRAVQPAMLREVQQRVERNWVSFVEGVDAWLKSLGPEIWTAELEKGGPALSLLLTRSAAQPVRLLSGNFYEPLMLSALQIISGVSVPQNAALNYSLLLKSLPPNSQARFEKDFFDRHDVHTAGISAALVHLEDVLNGLPFESKPDRTIERYLLPLVKLNSPEAKAFLGKHGPAFRAVMKSADLELTGQVKEFVESLDGEAEDTKALRDLLGIEDSKSR